eukprot:gene8674-10186_t
MERKSQPPRRNKSDPRLTTCDASPHSIYSPLAIETLDYHLQYHKSLDSFSNLRRIRYDWSCQISMDDTYAVLSNLPASATRVDMCIGQGFDEADAEIDTFTPSKGLTVHVELMPIVEEESDIPTYMAFLRSTGAQSVKINLNSTDSDLYFHTSYAGIMGAKSLVHAEILGDFVDLSDFSHLSNGAIKSLDVCLLAHTFAQSLTSPILKNPCNSSAGLPLGSPKSMTKDIETFCQVIKDSQTLDTLALRNYCRHATPTKPKLEGQLQTILGEMESLKERVKAMEEEQGRNNNWGLKYSRRVLITSNFLLVVPSFGAQESRNHISLLLLESISNAARKSWIFFLASFLLSRNSAWKRQSGLLASTVYSLYLAFFPQYLPWTNYFNVFASLLYITAAWSTTSTGHFKELFKLL